MDHDTPAPADPTLLEALRHLREPAALGVLVPLFAHGANNRLTVILAGLDLLSQVELSDPDLRETMRLAREAGAALGADLAALQSTSRSRSTPATTVKVADVVVAAIRLVELAASRRLAADVDIPPDLCVTVPPGAFEFALSQLLWLAVHRHPPLISLRASRLERPTLDAAVRTSRNRPRVLLALRLEGIAPAVEWVHATKQPGHVLERLREPDNLEFATVEAFAISVRGSLVTRADGSATVFELDLPAN